LAPSRRRSVADSTLPGPRDEHLPEPSDRLRLELRDPLARQADAPADLPEGQRLPVLQAEPRRHQHSRSAYPPAHGTPSFCDFLTSTPRARVVLRSEKNIGGFRTGRVQKPAHG